MEKLIEQFHAGNFSCVIAKGNDIRTYARRGILDLYELQKQDSSYLKGATIADKVVGKAAATLMVLAGIDRLYTDVISESALALLRHGGIEVEFAEVVPFIKNRDKSGWCPLETICKDEECLSTIVLKIETFIQNRKQ